jgi:K+-sensing histidine kinase KdpD
MPFATGRRRTQLLVASGALLLALGLLDYFTGYELGFFIFYFAPVSIAAWWGGRRPGVVMGVACAISWYVADRLTNHTYKHAYLIYWETIMRFASFITTALTLSKIRETVHEVRALHDALDRAKEENAELRRRLAEGDPTAAE